MKNNVPIKNLILKEENYNSISLLGTAFSSITRLKMIEFIGKGFNTVTSLSKKTGIPTSNILFHLQVLEKAGLVNLSSLSQKLVASPLVDNLTITLNQPRADQFLKEKEIEFQIPIGAYISISYLADHIRALNEKADLLNIDENNVYDYSRLEAQVLFFRRGLVSYPLRTLEGKEKLKCLYLSFEACSEINAYKNDYKSDISILINNKLLYTHTCPGDFGGRKGLLNPPNYPSHYTQFGQMMSVHINDKGVFFNGELVNDSITIKDIHLKNHEQNILSIGNIPSSTYQGGMNIFGEKLGDYPQAIKIKYIIEEKA